MKKAPADAGAFFRGTLTGREPSEPPERQGQPVRPERPEPQVRPERQP